MTRYKLTDHNHRTYNNTQWGKNVTHETNGEGELCSPGWLHCYSNPVLAILLNPIHANFLDPVLWEVEVEGECKIDRGLKEGWTKMTTTRILDIPEVTMVNRIAFGILCALEICKDEQFVQWANNWLNGSDRTKDSATAAYAAATADYKASYSAYTADSAAAAYTAAYAAANSAATAYSAEAAAYALDFDTIMKKAMELE